MIKVTVWNENLHEQRQEEVRQIYPQGIHGCIADFLGADRNLFVRTATLEEPEHGLTEEVLSDTDVLIYWGHTAHHAFSDEVAERVQRHVLQGMGLIALHSAHLAKIMIRLLGTSMTLRWRHGDRERLFATAPGHPIAQGFRRTLTFRSRRCTASILTFQSPMTWCSRAGLRAARCFAAVVPSSAGWAGFLFPAGA